MISDNLEVIQGTRDFFNSRLSIKLCPKFNSLFAVGELHEILTRLTGAVDVEIKYQTQSPEPSDTQSEPILHGHQATSKLKRVETVHDFRTEEIGDGSPIQEFEKLETGGEVEGIETTTPKYEATPNHSPKGKQSMLPTPSKSPKPFDTEAQEEEENDENPFLVTAGFEKDYLYAGSEFLEKKSVLEDLEPTEYEKVNIATSIVQWLNNFEKSDVKLTFLESILQYMQRKIENLSSTTFQAPDCPYLDQAWQSFRMILGTFANGVDLRPYDDEFKHIREQIPGDPNLHEHLRGWLDYLLHCVQVPDFRNSPESVFRCESLITEFTSRIYPIYSPSFNKLADGLYNIAEGLKEDSNSLTIIRLLKQIYATLSLDSAQYDIVEDLVLHIVPGVFQSLQSIPFPPSLTRTDTWQLFISDFQLRISTFVPTEIDMVVNHELNCKLGDPLKTKSMKSLTIRLNGIRPTIYDIPYTFSHTGFPTFMDLGLANLHFSKQGMHITLTLVMDKLNPTNFFTLESCHVDLESIQLTFPNKKLKFFRKKIQNRVRIAIIEQTTQKIHKMITTINQLIQFLKLKMNLDTAIVDDKIVDDVYGFLKTLGLNSRHQNRTVENIGMVPQDTEDIKSKEGPIGSWDDDMTLEPFKVAHEQSAKESFPWSSDVFSR
ncbi:hypothetical protein HDV02_000788 [Globomyces sp. JEL0801]|nr:hypothetical protein HDV02_000788 [Globomyces sp. JEL0801]